MIVQCVGCKSRLRVAEEKIPVDGGQKMRCPKCKAVFRVWHPSKAQGLAGAGTGQASSGPVPESGGAGDAPLSAAGAGTTAAPKARRAGTAIFGVGETASKTLPGAPGGTAIFGVSAPVPPQAPGSLPEDGWNQDGPASVFGGATNRRKSEHGTVLFGGGEEAPKAAGGTAGGPSEEGGAKSFPGQDTHDFFRTVTAWEHSAGNDQDTTPDANPSAHGGGGTFAADGAVSRRAGTSVFGAYVPETPSQGGPEAAAVAVQTPGRTGPSAADASSSEPETAGSQGAAWDGPKDGTEAGSAGAVERSSSDGAQPAPPSPADVSPDGAAAVPPRPPEPGASVAADGVASEEVDDFLLEEPSGGSPFEAAGAGMESAFNALEGSAPMDRPAALGEEGNGPALNRGEGADASTGVADPVSPGQDGVAFPRTGEDTRPDAMVELTASIQDGCPGENGEAREADVPDRADREAMRFRRKSSSMKGWVAAAGLTLVVAVAVAAAVSSPAFKRMAESLVSPDMESVLKELSSKSGLVLVKPALPARPSNRKGVKLLAYTCEVRNGGRKAAAPRIIPVDLMENGRVVASTKAAVGVSLAPEALLDVVSERGLGVLLKEGSAAMPPLDVGETRNMTVVFLKAPKNLEGTTLRFGWDGIDE